MLLNQNAGNQILFGSKETLKKQKLLKFVITNTRNPLLEASLNLIADNNFFE
jgi:hypothetical protein